MNRAFFFLALALTFVGTGCRQDMYNQPKYKPLAKSEFFDDDTSARPLPPHTIQRGHLDEDLARHAADAKARVDDGRPGRVH